MNHRGCASELSELDILDYEQRVKRYVSPENKGFINETQLIAAFKDTEIFVFKQREVGKTVDK